MIAVATGDREALTNCAQRLERLAADGFLGTRAGLQWVAALRALLEGHHEEAEAHFDQCDKEAVRLGGSHAQREIISETRRAGRLPVA
jgi:hypothetical protein